MAPSPLPQTATVTAIAGTTTTFTLFAQVSRANGRLVYNNSPNIVFLNYGTGATVTNYSIQIASLGNYAFPLPLYSGIVTGTCGANGGTVIATNW